MKITLKKLHMENFKKVKDQTIEFGHITKISGQNAVGKTTVEDAFMWCLFNKNSLGEAASMTWNYSMTKRMIKLESRILVSAGQ